jgi:hypothetical protein
MEGTSPMHYYALYTKFPPTVFISCGDEIYPEANIITPTSSSTEAPICQAVVYGFEVPHRITVFWDVT